MESLERSAASAARTLADDLLRPTADRDELSDHAETLSGAYAAARDSADRMRRQVDAAPRALRGTALDVLRRIDARLVQWQAVSGAVQDCLAGREWPLLPEDPPRLDLGGEQGALVSTVFGRAHRAINPAAQCRDAAGRGAHADIPLDPARFVAAAHLAYRLRLATKTPRPWRFLDVGCGGGVKVALAAEFFDDAVGIEIDPGYVRSARRSFAAMRAHRCEVIEADALTYDHYGGFDVIYCYQPMHDLHDLLALEQRIVARSRDDVILIAPYPGFAMRAASLGCVAVDGTVFVKASGAEGLDALLAETRRMGPHVYGADADPPQGLGWLRPLWLACTANGIRPD